MGRINRRAAVDIYMNKLVNGVPHLARTKDISLEGVYLHRLLEPRPPQGARIAVEFMLPGCEELIWAEADVMHGTHEGGSGLRFKHLSPRQRELIEDFIEGPVDLDAQA